MTYATGGAAEAIEGWLEYRGDEPGPLLWPVQKNGELVKLDGIEDLGRLLARLDQPALAKPALERCLALPEPLQARGGAGRVEGNAYVVRR